MKRFYWIIFLIVVLGAGLVWLGCSNEPANVTGPGSESQQIAKLTPGAVGLERAMAVQNEHTHGLMAISGVVGTATGLGPNGTPAVLVLTKAPGIPGIPPKLDGIPVIVKVTGEIRALLGEDKPPRWFPRPVPIGVSTGHPDITAGTIGARVKDDAGDVYALSNNHVYADENNASILDNVLQPGTVDGGVDPEDAIGSLFDFETIVFHPRARNEIDAAIALSSTVELGNATPSDGYGIPSSTTVSASLGQAVQKYGRTTSLTKGTITGVNATVRVGYSSGTAKFVNQIIIEDGSFSDGGDSGSLVVTDDDYRNPVGLLFAGSASVTIANRIDPVLDRFNVSIDGEGGGEPVNTSPTAIFSFNISGLTVDFTDESTDDGTVEAWEWDFGDDQTSDGQNPSNTYIESGTYGVTLTVTDNDGATDSKSTDVTVTEHGTEPPVVTGCEPDNGSPGERMIVVISGSNFLDGATVDFGGAGIVVQSVSFVDSNHLNVKINIQRKATTGSRDVTVTNPDNQSSIPAAVFTVN